MKSNLELLIRYPLILSKADSPGEYFGYVKANETDYRVDFAYANGKIKLNHGKDLEPFGDRVDGILKERYEDVVSFLDKLTALLTRHSRKIERHDPVDLYRKVLNEYSELRQFYINLHSSKLSKDLRNVEIVHSDERNRKHRVLIAVDYKDERNMFAVVECDLPEHEARLVSTPRSSLVAVYENFVSVVDGVNLQTAFDVLDAIDANCWVTDPEKPTRKDLYRRIVVDGRTSCVVTFNSTNFRELPRVKLLGPQQNVKTYYETVNKNFINWNPNGDILLELLRLLEIKNFPRQQTGLLEEELLVGDGDCCICFSMRLGEKLPEVVCPNESCRQNFHVDCLYEWLTSLNSKKLLYELYGNCPNCEKSIRCPLPS